MALALALLLGFVVPLKTDLTPKIHLIVDVSGSVEWNFEEVLKSVETIAGAGRDELDIRITRFADEAADFKFEKGKVWSNGPLGPKRMAAVKEWLKEGSGGNTFPLGPLTKATQQRGKGISVVFVTDGIFTTAGTDAAVTQLVAASKHPVMIYGVGGKSELLKGLGKVGNGYYEP